VTALFKAKEPGFMTGPSRIRVKPLISFFLLIFATLTALHGAVLFFLHQTQYKKNMTLIVEYQENMILLEQQKISTELQSVLEKLSLLEVAVEKSVRSGRLPENPAEYASFFRLVGERSGQFAVIRLISTEGKELFRMNFDEKNNGLMVSSGELQDKRDRYYFQELKEVEESIYISPLDLNIENSALEQPYNPVIRFGRSILDERGKTVAYLILNYRADRILKDLGQYELLPQESFQTYLLNNEGFWLKGPDPSREFGFMHEGLGSETVAETDKDLWAHLQVDEKGGFLLNGNLYVHRSLPLKKLIKPEWGRYISRNRQNERSFYLVYYTSRDVLKDMSRNISRALFPPFLITQLLIIIITSAGTAGYGFYLKNEGTLQFLISLDALTECLNPGTGKKILDRTWSLVHRRNSVMTVVYTKLAGLEDIREKYGYGEGDLYILTLIKMIRRQLRNSDFLIRLDEDDYLMILPDCICEQGVNICARIEEQIQEINKSETRSYKLSLEYGVLEADREKHLNADELIQDAREIMESRI